MNRAILRFYFTFSIVLLVLLLFSFPLIEPGSGSMVIAKLTFGLLGSIVLLTGVLIYRESRRGPDVPINLDDRE